MNCINKRRICMRSCWRWSPRTRIIICRSTSLWSKYNGLKHRLRFWQHSCSTRCAWKLGGTLRSVGSCPTSTTRPWAWPFQPKNVLQRLMCSRSRGNCSNTTMPLRPRRGNRPLPPNGSFSSWRISSRRPGPCCGKRASSTPLRRRRFQNRRPRPRRRGAPLPHRKRRKLPLCHHHQRCSWICKGRFSLSASTSCTGSEP
mmetsp:Transcript_12431/g.34234  ORF Transcript_12431/g.34234 Transcript_12431/m.34234 type:complete len:200 (-) Transcript_12431:1340-1939(-)